jgi:hypothetical protein
MRVLWEIMRHPGWDIENLADALGAGLADIAHAVDALLRAGMLRDHAGEFVLIRDATVYGYSPDMDAAIAEGYRRLGGGPFLAKRVEIEVPASFASNLIRPPRGR